MSLCLSCGLCCDGTLFSTVPLEAGEASRLKGKVSLKRGGASMTQPCRALEGVSCRVYEERPATCRRFRCLALQQLEAGEVSEGDAQAFIAEVFARRRRLAETLDLDDEQKALKLARAQAKDGSISPQTLHALERLTRLLMFLNLSQEASS
ncbi:MAG: YkgJ family cysteine cluster protein [Archangium sp.]|nr:YkgJ family cysteine cluster protein [Archangium sp.]